MQFTSKSTKTNESSFSKDEDIFPFHEDLFSPLQIKPNTDKKTLKLDSIL